MPTPKKNGRGKKRGGAPKSKRAAPSVSARKKARDLVEQKRLAKNARARERRLEKKAEHERRSLAAMRPARRAKAERDKKNTARRDLEKWKAAGSPPTFASFQARQQGLRTRKLNAKREALGRKRNQIFGYATESGTDLGKVPERFQLDGRNRDQWHVLREMMRDNDPRWQAHLEAADELDLDYDEAADGWFSPEV